MARDGSLAPVRPRTRPSIARARGKGRPLHFRTTTSAGRRPIRSSAITVLASLVFAGSNMVLTTNEPLPAHPATSEGPDNSYQSATFEPWGDRFLARASNYNALVRPDGFEVASDDGSRFSVELVGARKDAEMRPSSHVSGLSNYYMPPEKGGTRVGIPIYRSLEVREVIEGIDLRYRADGLSMAFDLLIAPGVAAESVRLYLANAVLTPEGDLSVESALGRMELSKPQAIQADGKSIESAYVERAPGVFGIDVGARDPNVALLIDPTLEYSTYLGGAQSDSAVGVAVDSEGNAYLAGATRSPDFPLTPGAAQASFASSQPELVDGFVTKFNSTGSDLVYSTYFGGSGEDFFQEIALDGTGNAFVTGRTTSSNYPTSPGALQRELKGTDDAVITKLGPLGELEYSTYLGGSDYEWGRSIAVDLEGNAYLVGETRSIDFPVTAGAFMPTNLARSERASVFVAKVVVDGSKLDFATYLGGTDGQWGVGVAVGPDRSVYVAGRTQSADFPTTDGALYRDPRGAADAFVTRFDPSGKSLIYSTYFGGSAADAVYGIAVDGEGNAYIGGETRSADLPAVPAAPASRNKNGSVYAAKLNPAGSLLLYSTAIGGSQIDWGLAIAVDSAGRASIVGWTSSEDFATTPDAFTVRYPGGETSGFFVRLDEAGTALTYATYIGGAGGASAQSVAVDNTGDVYVAGAIRSDDLPVVRAFQIASKGEDDAFLIKFRFSAGGPPSVEPSVGGSRSVDGEGNQIMTLVAGLAAASAVAGLVFMYVSRRRSRHR